MNDADLDDAYAAAATDEAAANEKTLMAECRKDPWFAQAEEVEVRLEQHGHTKALVRLRGFMEQFKSEAADAMAEASMDPYERYGCLRSDF